MTCEQGVRESRNFENLFHHPLRVRQLLVFDVMGVNGGSIEAAHSLYRCIEMIEGVFLNESGHLCRDAVERLGLIDQDRPIGLHHRADDGVLIQGTDGAEIHHFGRDAVFRGQVLCRVQGVNDGATMGMMETSVPSRFTSA